MTQNRTSGMLKVLDASGILIRSAIIAIFLSIFSLVAYYGVKFLYQNKPEITATAVVHEVEKMTVNDYLNSHENIVAYLATIPREFIRVNPEEEFAAPTVPVETYEQRVRRLVQAQLDEVDRSGGIARIRDQQLLCLAKNIYFESRGQPIEGQVGVAKVTLNRLEEGYSSSICGVVRQRFVPTVCQFSWVCTHPNVRPAGEPWRLAIGIAMAALHLGTEISDPTNGATHFHATYVRPKWSRTYTHAGQIGDHVFYRASTR